MKNDPVFHIEGVSWTTPSGLPIVKGVSFDVQRGEVFGILGPNGAGKTTLLKMLYRVLRPQHGTIHLYGRDVWTYPREEFARSVSVVLQESLANFSLSVEEVVATGRLPYLKTFSGFGAAHRAIVKDCLDCFGLSKIADRRYSILSGGEKQRVIFARALAQKADIMILDEPTNHLDIRHQLDVLTGMRKWAGTIILTVHDINFAARYCDRLLILQDGGAVACGTPEQVLKPDLFHSVFSVSTEKQADPRLGTPLFSFYPSEESQSTDVGMGASKA